MEPTLIDRTILFFLGGQVIINTFAGYLEYYHINNQWLYSLNILFFVVIFTIYFYKDLSGIRTRKIILVWFLFFLIFFCFSLIFFQPYRTFNSYSYALGALLIVIYSLLGLRQLINYSPEYDILRLKNFWFAAGILLYFGSSFFIFMSFHYLSAVSAKDVGVLWKIHNLFLAISSAIFLKAIMSKEWITK
ncbi:MAG: hypothetical protein ACM3H8_15640 [Sphingobacteriales bacterium]